MSIPSATRRSLENLIQCFQAIFETRGFPSPGHPGFGFVVFVISNFALLGLNKRFVKS